MIDLENICKILTCNFINFRKTLDRFILLQIDNLDNKALNISGVRLEGVARSILFLAEPKTSYKLYYDNKDAKILKYDIVKVVKYFDENEVFKAYLEKQKDNKSYIPEKPKQAPIVPLTERLYWLLPLVFGIATLFLITLMYLVFKKTGIKRLKK